MSKHTAGPWKVVPVGKGFAVIAKGERVNLSRDGWGSIGGEGEANARLIAAAPDLLALARQYASECAECEGSGVYGVKWWHQGIENDGERPCEACADIRAAIAKAEGRA